MTALTPLIAELEEAERFLREMLEKADPECVVTAMGGGHASELLPVDIARLAHAVAHLPTLLEALKRQGEALEKIAAGQFPETPDDPDDADMLDMAISGRRHMMALARSALTAHKEKSDV